MLRAVSWPRAVRSSLRAGRQHRNPSSYLLRGDAVGNPVPASTERGGRAQ